MKTKLIYSVLFFLSISISFLSAQNRTASEYPIIEQSDMEKLEGDWTGTITYVDYSSGNPFTMPCDVAITSKSKNRKWALSYEYPKEPKANSKGKLKFSKNQRTINGKTIVSREENADGSVQIITEYQGKDGNDRQQATIRIVYLISATSFEMQKEVQFVGTKEWLTRNTYAFTRK